MSSSPQPLKIQRFGTLFLSFALAVVSLGVSINARVKANDAVNKGAVVSVDTKDISDVGDVLLAGCALQVVLSALYIVFISFPRRTTALSLRLQGWSLYFCGLWLLATLIPFDVFFATRQAQVSATLNGVPVPAAQVQSMEEALGLSPYYKDASYCTATRIANDLVFSSETCCHNTLGLHLCLQSLQESVLQIAAGNITFGNSTSQGNEKEP
ncbi:hypothetical protein EDC04DRAFT_2673641 [Pisolithus marmoratus]|nr:hypothetical protein EDC04DRAFT_2673641 [Pisolithus marmoratus]